MTEPYTPPEYTAAPQTFSGINLGQSTPPANSNITDITEGTLDGNGVFDVLMRTCKLHLMEEYTNRRITGKEYATVYLGLISAVLQAAGAYIVQHRQAEKVVAEAGLLRQKIVTELSATADSIPTDLAFNTSTNVAGTVGKQKSLYQAQTDGFSRDAEQKLLKILADTWSVRRTTDEGTSVTGTGLDDLSIGAVVSKAKAGIGA